MSEKISGNVSSRAKLTGYVRAPAKLTGTVQIPSSVGVKSYEGPYEVIPKAYESQTLETKQKLMEDNVFIFSVPYFQTSNEHGDTVYIASEV